MASCRKKYTADDFKKDKVLSDSETDDESDESSASEDEDSDTSSHSSEAKFIKEDKLISRLYREVVDYIMNQHGIRESNVSSAIADMKAEINVGHKKGFRNFRAIRYSGPSESCAYLRRYAICHTGLVKQLMLEFFSSKGVRGIAKNVRKEIMGQNHLKIISLGGGPGNDLVGFCSALQGTPNFKKLQNLDLIIVDINKSWKDVFPVVLQKARRTNYGSFSQCLKDIKIKTGFKEADLTAEGTFEEEDLSASLEQVDIVLMVKLTSFLPDHEAGALIDNVVNSMKPEAKLIFIDQPYDIDFFRKIKCLRYIYSSFTNYELSYKPSQYQSPSITSAQAHIGIYKKIDLSEEDSFSDSENW